MEWGKIMDTTFHSLSITVVAGTLLAILPPIAAALSIVWFIICIVESRTFQHWKANMQMKRRARKLMRLRAKEKIVLASIQALETVRAARVEAREAIAVAKSEAAQLVAHEAFKTDEQNIQ